MSATAVVAEGLDGVSLRACTETGRQTTEFVTPITGISGAKRSRDTFDNEQQPSVRVIYNSLTRESISKLQELLLQWSEWHAQNCSSDDSDKVIECGEKTYFPALRVGLDKPSVVFWMDDKRMKTPNEELSSKDNGSAPIYDREYTFVLTSSDASENSKRSLDVANAPRCFNCNSYNHSLKECSKPRDNIAVSNARKHRKTSHNQSANAINKIRYYQNTPGGKYDNLRPGVLGAETRKALGLGELEPPPWLNRMRELGYPPGYLVKEDENIPSGIRIFADKEISEEGWGEISETGYLKSQESRKMTVEFPGLNAPVPEKADKRLWTAGESCVGTHDGNSEKCQFNISPDRSSREHFHEQRWFRDLNYDDGPPRFSPGMNIYPPRYGGYYGRHHLDGLNGNGRHHLDGFNGNIPIHEYPLYERSFSDIGLKGLLDYEEFPRNHSHYSFHFSPPRANPPMTSFGPASLENSIGSSRTLLDEIFLSSAFIFPSCCDEIIVLLLLLN